MPTLRPHEIAGFLKRFRFRGARLSRVAVRRTKFDPSIELFIRVRQAITDLGASNAPVRLRLRLADVREFSIRKRPNDDRMVLRKTDLSHLHGQFYLTFESYLDEGESPAIHDFRATDLYFAFSSMEWEILTKPPAGEPSA